MLTDSYLVVKQKITAFRQDELGDWIVDLSCGHARHVRHNPPFQNRPWVLTEESRRAMLGEEIECGNCDREKRA